MDLQENIQNKSKYSEQISILLRLISMWFLAKEIYIKNMEVSYELCNRKNNKTIKRT